MRSVGFTVVVTTFLVAAVVGYGAAGAGRAPARACIPAAIEDVSLRAPLPVDEIRVHVDERSPEAGAARVEVIAGDFDRVLHVLGVGGRSLQFYPALFSSSYRITIDPVLPAPADACVERVELLSAGRVVAAVEP